MGFMLGGDQSYPGLIYALTPINIHEWHMLAFWYDAAADQIKMRIDSGAVETFDWSGGTPATGAAFAMGGSLTADGQAVSSDFDGRVDEVLWIKNDIVTTDELDYLYNSGTGRTLYP
jgi:hypothetical protein